MKRKNKHQNVPFRITKNKVFAYGIMATAVAAIGYFGWYAMIPANGTFPVFAPRDEMFSSKSLISFGEKSEKYSIGFMTKIILGFISLL